MNLRTAKVVKKTLGNIPYILMGLVVVGWLTCGVILTKGILLLVIAGGVVVYFLIIGGCRLYDKATRTIAEIEEGDNGGRPHHLDYYGKDRDDY